LFIQQGTVRRVLPLVLLGARFLHDPSLVRAVALRRELIFFGHPGEK